MKYLLLFSVLLNLALASLILYTLDRLGGWKYALYRLKHGESGLYAHRKMLFEMLPARPGAVVFFGDSQSEQCEWAELAGGDTAVINRGISGDNVDGAWARLDEILRHRPSKIFLQIGVNDLIWGKTPEAVEVRYREIVRRIRREQPEAQLILESVLPVNNRIRDLPVSNGDIQALNSYLAQIARDYALPYVDLYTPLADGEGCLSAEYTNDGIHLNGRGYLVWKKQIESYQ